ncbi:cardiolipin synthase [Brevibacterium jeotgali]|uniref:Cardiolipin synthase n=1 Tax=Brevibacterium jeotgali TaxID=1262550 RepID=A0A2H1L549_9MICO|nr:cardiolipin synthase [Brevibacterium jeotgali]TWB98520.1 cardiolipin synthase [Brevibacterium jeotgali]SMY12027.1 cardiolipin synthase [Brevibacterium jeotgali]
MDPSGIFLWIQSQLPGWLALGLLIIDFCVRVVALGTIPYRRKASVALGWLILIFMLPFVGILIFLVFGSPKLPARRREKQHEINQRVKAATGHRAIIGESSHLAEPLSTAAQLNYELGALPMVHGNEFGLITDSVHCVDRMAEEVAKARRYVHFEFYIVAIDDTTRPLIEALIAAHERGVVVRILIDHVGSIGYPGYRSLVKLLDESGLMWRRSLPIRPWKGEYQRPDLRNHRKILVVDGQTAFTGSQNIIHPSYNTRRNRKRGLVWKDLMVRCTGPIVDELDAVFASDWYSETDDALFGEFDEELDAPPESAGIMAQVVPSGPGFDHENNLQLFTHLIYNANRTVVVSSPYFVPDNALLTALKTESQSGVDVRLYVGATNDHWVVGKAQESYYDELVEAGVTIYQYRAPTVLHSKFILVDDHVTVIGSSNMDERSFAMNHEVSLFIVDEEFTRQMYALEREDYQAHSAPLDAARWRERSWVRKYVENVCRLGSSLL